MMYHRKSLKGYWVDIVRSECERCFQLLVLNPNPIRARRLKASRSELSHSKLSSALICLHIEVSMRHRYLAMETSP